MHLQSPEDDSDFSELARIGDRIGRVVARTRRNAGRARFLFAPTVAQCLRMVGDLEKGFGGERAAAEIIGPSVITVQSWKRRRTMSVPSRRLVWLIWALTLHPERIQSVDDLVTWGRLRQPG